MSNFNDFFEFSDNQFQTSSVNILCAYGCNKQATTQLKNGIWCCSLSPNRCISVISKIKKSNEKRLNIQKQQTKDKNKHYCKTCNKEIFLDILLIPNNNTIEPNIQIKA